MAQTAALVVDSVRPSTSVMSWNTIKRMKNSPSSAFVCRLCVLVLGVLILLGADSAEQSESDTRWTPDKFLFAGKLVGVSVTSSDRLALHFHIQEPLTMFPTHREAIVRVNTDAKIDLDTLTEENYADRVQKHLPDGLWLGGQALVAYSHTGATGFELVASEALSETARQAWLEKHSRHIERFDQYVTEQMWRGSLRVLRSAHNRVTEFEQRREEHRDDERSTAFYEQKLEQAREHFESQQSVHLAQLLQTLEELEAAVNDAPDDSAKTRLKKQITTLQAIIAEARNLGADK